MSLVFTKEHEWLLIEDDVVTLGITEYAQEQLGDIVFVDLPAQNQEINMGEEVAVIESVKAASEITSPVNGTVIEVNGVLKNSPEIVNQDPMGDGWLFKVRLEGDFSPSEFMDEASYLAVL